jgi:hypothetical protein
MTCIGGTHDLTYAQNKRAGRRGTVLCVIMEAGVHEGFAVAQQLGRSRLHTSGLHFVLSVYWYSVDCVDVGLL